MRGNNKNMSNARDVGRCSKQQQQHGCKSESEKLPASQPVVKKHSSLSVRSDCSDLLLLRVVVHNFRFPAVRPSVLGASPSESAVFLFRVCVCVVHFAFHLDFLRWLWKVLRVKFGLAARTSRNTAVTLPTFEGMFFGCFFCCWRDWLRPKFTHGYQPRLLLRSTKYQEFR